MRQTIREPERAIRVCGAFDVCVVGGGCTGVFAAVRAARLGARVALVEQTNCFGGVATNGLVNVWHSLHDAFAEERIIAGLTAEVLERLEKRDALLKTKMHLKPYIFNSEELKIELDELVQGSRIEPFLHTFYAAPVTEDGRLIGIVVENKSGRSALLAGFFIDATGDGDLCDDLGLLGSKTEDPQPATTCAKIIGLSTRASDERPDSVAVVDDWEELVRQHGAEFGLEPDWGWRTVVPNMPGVIMHSENHLFGFDTSKGDQLTRAEMEGRRCVRAMMDVVRRYGKDPGNLALVQLASYVGARETNHIAALYTLTPQDLLGGRLFHDAIAYGSYPVDIHHAGGWGITYQYLDGTEVAIPGRGMPKRVGRWRASDPGPGYYAVPFRCLIPSTGAYGNILAAGRIVDADRAAFGAVRVMVNMNQTGEAAGVAAWLALQSGVSVSDVDHERLKEEMVKGGSLIPAASRGSAAAGKSAT
jgi:hypothetical protein